MILTIRDGSSNARVSTIGATIMSWTPGGADVIDGYVDEAELASLDGYRGAVLAPWSNRIAGGAWNDRGLVRKAAQAGNPDPLGLHGLVYDREFEVVKARERSVVLSTDITPTEGYPFTVTVTVRFEVAGDCLNVSITGKNVGLDPAPIGLGWHPYFWRGNGEWDVDVTHWIENDASGIPLDNPFRPLARLDDVEPAWDNAVVGGDRISFPVRGGRIDMSANLPTGPLGVGIWHLFGGATLARGAGQSVAVEPCMFMTDSLNRLVGEMLVEPGCTAGLAIDLVFTAASA